MATKLTAVWIKGSELQAYLDKYGKDIAFISVDRKNPWNGHDGCNILLVINK